MSVDPAPQRDPRSRAPAAGRSGLAGVVRTAVVMVGFVTLLWVIEIADTLSQHRLDQWGISPRDPSELPDIATAPFLHAGFNHLAANTVPLLILGFLAALRGLGRFAAVSALIVVVSGLGVWLISPPHTVTLGASGLIFGYFGYVVLRGFLDRSLLDIALGVAVLILYGSVLWGVLPLQSGVSWQGHLFGLLGGALAAWVFRRRKGRRVVGP
jgi:membrane associated rhomboid family serine protease